MLGFSVILEKNNLELNEVTEVKEDRWVKKWEFGYDFFFSTLLDYTNIHLCNSLLQPFSHPVLSGIFFQKAKK
jgi:hypothetical protein